MTESIVKDELQRLYEAHHELTPDLVLDTARDPDNPLHGHFEWDDGVAAEEWRKNQARKLIRSVKIVFEKPDGEKARVRKYHSVHVGEVVAYRDTEEIVQDPEMTAVVLAVMKREWMGLKRKYGHFAEFVDLVRSFVEEEAEVEAEPKAS